jgi:hypothetical protein
MGGYLSCYLFAMLENDRLTPLDIVLRPFSICAAVALNLPATFWRVGFSVWGLTILCSAFLIGGFANRDLWDWGGQPAKISLVKAISQQALSQTGEFGNLEDAIEAAAKKADSLSPGDANEAAKQPQILVDCLIFGYEPMGNDDFSSLLLAAADAGGKLRFVGTVSQGISSEVRAELNKRMRKLEQPEPFIHSGVVGTWLKPTLTCRVAAKEISESHKLVHPVFQQMLNDISVH